MRHELQKENPRLTTLLFPSQEKHYFSVLKLLSQLIFLSFSIFFLLPVARRIICLPMDRRPVAR
jgi:hypothetical protein